MTARHLRVRLDFQIPVPDEYAGVSPSEAVEAMPEACRARTLALCAAITASRADAEDIGDECGTWGVRHLCVHPGGPCPGDEEL